jgi:hypothetical protein
VQLFLNNLQKNKNNIEICSAPWMVAELHYDRDVNCQATTLESGVPPVLAIQRPSLMYRFGKVNKNS